MVGIERDERLERIVAALKVVISSMIFSENRCTLFRIML